MLLQSVQALPFSLTSGVRCGMPEAEPGQETKGKRGRGSPQRQHGQLDCTFVAARLPSTKPGALGRPLYQAGAVAHPPSLQCTLHLAGVQPSLTILRGCRCMYTSPDTELAHCSLCLRHVCEPSLTQEPFAHLQPAAFCQECLRAPQTTSNPRRSVSCWRSFLLAGCEHRDSGPNQADILSTPLPAVTLAPRSVRGGKATGV